MTEVLRLLPSMSQVLARRGVRRFLREWQKEIVRDLCREVLEELRLSLRGGQSLPEVAGSTRFDSSALLRIVESRVSCRLADLERPQLRRVVNATGVLLHTNFGRARLGAQAAAEAARVASEPVALEVSLETGRRGQRGARVERLLQLLTGAPRALAVNNGAAALWLAVRALAPRGGRVLVSRGEQVAIGGSFRMPELLKTTGAKMVDVGTTNRTTAEDYAAELSAGDLLLKVHPSNYRVTGFHEEASLNDLSRVAREKGATLLYDAGSGSLLDYRRFGLHGEATVRECLGAGADVVTFSGDKLLGGPQAGLAVGRSDPITSMLRHPLMRALRCDKMVLASLERSLLSYARRPKNASPELPLFRALEVGSAELRRRARELASSLREGCPEGWTVRAQRSEAAVGGGSFAETALPSWMVSLEAPDARTAHRLHQSLRRGEPAVYTRIDGCEVGLDLRSVDTEELELLLSCVSEAWSVPSKSRVNEESA